MASAGPDDRGRKPPDTRAARSKPDRHAEALRANLMRRKAQTRARDEAQRDAPRPGTFQQDC